MCPGRLNALASNAKGYTMCIDQRLSEEYNLKKKKDSGEGQRGEMAE